MNEWGCLVRAQWGTGLGAQNDTESSGFCYCVCGRVTAQSQVTSGLRNVDQPMFKAVKLPGGSLNLFPTRQESALGAGKQKPSP